MLRIACWISIAAVSSLVVGACSDDDDHSAIGRLGAAGEAGSGASIGGSAQSGSRGNGGASGAAGAHGWTCETGYRLASYDGDQSGLCAPTESRWVDCCDGAGADIAEAIVTRCAPDGSVCVADSYCTLFNTATFECGWLLCDPDNAPAAGGAGGAADSDCPWDKAREALERATNEGDPGPIPCATDRHCEKTHQVCNLRIANRMFCGDPDSSGQGGTGD
jgi:hypothetical protein